MQITLDNFKRIVGSKALWDAGLKAFPVAHSKAVHFYCEPLTMRNACTGECDVCALRIKNLVQWLVEHNDGKNMYGIYVKLLKNNLAARVEEVAKRPEFKPETNALGEQTERDALDILMETLNA